MGLLPDPGVRPVELAAREGKQRQRASRKKPSTQPWSWAEDGDDA